ncbi:MAG: NAD(P)-binding domain-containing protein, partial [Deltaproteobacteria bacterium]|nr:NAD(P)-binding domain-containing protein [Deltaproteobacteria bacterium]
MSRSEHVAVIGAGLMGHGIAQIFVSGGNEVFLYDLSPEVLQRTKNKIRSNLKFLSEKGVGSQIDVILIISEFGEGFYTLLKMLKSKDFATSYHDIEIDLIVQPGIETHYVF